MSIEIRPVVAADHEAWLPLWQGYQRFYMTEIPAETGAVTWQRFLDPAEPMGAALAWRGDQAIGLVHWVIHRSTWTIGDYCYLQDLFTVPAARGRGVGRALIEAVYERAGQAGASRVWWLTQEANYAGRMLYDQVADRPGFIQYRKQL